MDEVIPLGDNMDEFNKIVQDLESLLVKIDDEDQTIILINSLPRLYALFVDA